MIILLFCKFIVHWIKIWPSVYRNRLTNLLSRVQHTILPFITRSVTLFPPRINIDFFFFSDVRGRRRQRGCSGLPKSHISYQSSPSLWYVLTVRSWIDGNTHTILRCLFLSHSNWCFSCRRFFKIHFVLLISRQGVVRLTKWYSPYTQKERSKVSFHFQYYDSF